MCTAGALCGVCAVLHVQHGCCSTSRCFIRYLASLPRFRRMSSVHHAMSCCRRRRPSRPAHTYPPAYPSPSHLALGNAPSLPTSSPYRCCRICSHPSWCSYCSGSTRSSRSTPSSTDAPRRLAAYPPCRPSPGTLLPGHRSTPLCSPCAHPPALARCGSGCCSVSSRSSLVSRRRSTCAGRRCALAVPQHA